jgi:hypothetical protein
MWDTSRLLPVSAILCEAVRVPPFRVEPVSRTPNPVPAHGVPHTRVDGSGGPNFPGTVRRALGVKRVTSTLVTGRAAL